MTVHKHQINPSSFVAPNAMICGDVRIGKNVKIMFGAQIIAENSAILIGDNCIVLENAVLRGTYGFPVTIGDNCLIGPNTHLAGCTIENEVFIATGASVFHGAIIKSKSEVRVNGVVHVNSVLESKTTVPIGWVAVGSPAKVFSPDQHEAIWEIQKTLEFDKTVYGVEGSDNRMPQICKIMTQRLA